jgi:CRISPR-associated exonuclease Cas4
LGQFDPSVSIIDCGSKHNLQLYIAILNAFALSYVVIHDEDPIPDPVPREWSEDKVREKQRTFDLNVEIAGHVDPALGETIILRPDCEGFFGISGSQGGKKGKALAALDHFASKEADAISQDMRELVTRIFER